MHTLLIVDDDRATRTMLGRRFEHLPSIHVTYAANGEQALQVAQLDIPDLILLDYRMPIMDGSQMIHALDASEWGNKIPIVLVTASPNSYILDEQDDIDIELVLQKPISPRKLETIVLRLLDHHDKGVAV